MKSEKQQIPLGEAASSRDLASSSNAGLINPAAKKRETNRQHGNKKKSDASNPIHNKHTGTNFRVVFGNKLQQQIGRAVNLHDNVHRYELEAACGNAEKYLPRHKRQLTIFYDDHWQPEQDASVPDPNTRAEHHLGQVNTQMVTVQTLPPWLCLDLYPSD